MHEPNWIWAVFFAVIVGLLVFDLGVLNRKAKIISSKHSLRMTSMYVTISLCFGAWVWQTMGAVKGKEFLSGYMVETMLALDNIFVISLIFAYFNIPREYQHRVLFWGILGAIVLRGFAIGAGTVIIAEFEWVLLLFAVFLIFTGLKMLFIEDDPETDFSNNRVLKFMRRFLPITPQLHQNYFTVKLPDPDNGGALKRYFTPLFLALVLVECADVVFALDSIPAIFAITTDPFIVYTSNIFAILGLRSMYFLLSAALHRFEYLKYSVSCILVFIGVKVLTEHIFDEDPISPLTSFVAIVTMLGVGVFYSLMKTSHPEAEGGEKP